MKNKQAHSPRSGNARARRRDLRQAATGLATASVLAVGLPAATALAGTGSCAGSGAIEVSDPRIGECQLQSGDALSVTGTGSITGDGASTVVGVRVVSGQTGVQITNDGDIVGNPFRPVSFLPEWRTDTAVALARQMYESREFGAMPILADALQDAGCDDAAVLDHCRGPGPHVRGCWVVDLVLGKEEGTVGGGELAIFGDL